MRDQELDRLFDRFRRRGDVQALGAVFDATAPELLQVAMSLVHDPGEADDLLQETFLTAIERAQRYDAERRLVPWLLGILAHHAKERRRLRQRPLDPTRLAERSVATPEAEARGRELEAELDRALAELSARERVVLEAHLRHGKGAAEIASETGAAPGAVRMQIHRGLDRLRKVLPVGLALGGAASAQGMGAVRAAVLRAGESAAKGLAPGAGSAFGGGTAGMLMANKLALAGVAAALVAGIFLVRSLGGREDGGPREVARAESREEPRAPGDLRAADLAAPGTPAPVAEPQTRARVAADPARDPDRAGLRGRVVEHDGTPVPGLAVGLLQLDERELAPVEHATAQPPRVVMASARTDAEGAFVLEGATVGALTALGIDLGGERATLRVLDVVLTPGATADVGDVVLLATGVVTGRVVDAQGNGVAGARVRVGPVPWMVAQFGLAHVTAGGAFVQLDRTGAALAVLELPEWLSALEARLPFATTTSGPDGRFELSRAAAGSPTVLVDRAGYARQVTPAFELAPGARVELGNVVLERGESLRGRVVDSAGAPVAAAQVRAGILSRERELNVFAPIAACDADGRFELGGIPTGWKSGVIARRDELGPWIAGRAHEGELVVQLPREHELVIEAVDGAGLPVPAPEFSMRVKSPFEELGVFAPPLVARQAQSLDAAAGRWSLGRVQAGAYLVVARAPGLMPATASLMLGDDAPALTRLVLPAERRVEVSVLDSATRAPLAGALVRVAEGHTPAVVESALTGADGRAVLALPDTAARVGGERRQLFLRVEHARFAPAKRPLGDASSQEVALTAGARLRARLVDPSLARLGCMLVLQHEGDGELRDHLPLLAALPREGALELERLAPGNWSWLLRSSFVAGEALAFLEPPPGPEPHAAGRITLVEGQTFELSITAELREERRQPPPRPSKDGASSLSGVIQLDGRPAGPLQINLMPLGHPGQVEFVESLAGDFRFEGLVPGSYLLMVEQEGGQGFELDETIDINPSEERTVAFDVTLLQVNARVVDEDGKALQGVSVSVSPSDRESWIVRELQTDAKGEALFTVTRAGPYRFSATDLQRGTGAVELEIAPGPRAEATITLSAGVECAGRVVLPRGCENEGGTTNLVVLASGETAPRLVVPQEISSGAGEFRIAGLEPGNYNVWMVIGRRSFHTEFRLPEFGSTTIELAFEERALHPDD